MSGAGLDKLRCPLRRYNPALRGDFPSKKCCIRRDRRVAASLRDALNSPDLIVDPKDLRELAHRLDYTSRGEDPPHSRAAQGFYGSVQKRLGGAVWRLIDETQCAGHEVSFVTLCPRELDIRPDQVMAVEPRRWGRQQHTALDRVVRSKALGGRGWSILFLDCEYQEAEGIFQFHYHGFASGIDLIAIDSLRHLRKYCSPRATGDEDRDPVRFRVRMTRKPLEDLGYLCIYPIKREWRCRPVPSNQPGNRDRSWPRPLPRELVALERQFYDRWSIQDISVVRGLRVINGRLKPTR